MATEDDKPKKNEWWRRWLDFIFEFENKKGDLLDYWMYSADGFTFPPQEFYATVEEKLAERKIPSMEIRREEFAQAGLLSNQRLYLRLMRERLAITTCAAPFGTIFFFSCRTIYIPAKVRLWHILAALFFLFAAYRLLIIPLGGFFASIALTALIFAIAGVLRNASTGGIAALDAILLRIPVVATIYEDWFRVDTFYRTDTRNLYLKLVPQFIQELAEETCAAKGVKLKPQFQRTPPVADFTKPSPVDEKPPSI